MSGDKPLWEVVGGADKGGILVRSGQGYSSEQYGRRLAHGALVWERELRGERLHYEKAFGNGPDSGWISVKFKGKDLVVRLEGVGLLEGLGGSWAAGCGSGRATEVEGHAAPVAAGPEASQVETVEDAEVCIAVESVTAAGPPQEPTEEERERQAEDGAEVCIAVGSMAAAGAPQELTEEEGGRQAEQEAEAAEDAEVCIAVESMTAAGPPQELTVEERERQAEAERFRVDMLLEEEAFRRCEVWESRDHVADRGVFVMISTSGVEAAEAPAHGGRALFADAFNASLAKVRQELAKKDCPRSGFVEAITRFLASVVLLLNAAFPCRFRPGIGPCLEKLHVHFAQPEAGVCAALREVLKEERTWPDGGPSPAKQRLAEALWQVLDSLSHLPGLLLLPAPREAEGRVLEAARGYLALHWRTVLAPRCGAAPGAPPPAEPAPPDAAVPPELASSAAGFACSAAFGVLFCGSEMMPDVVFFRPANFSLRWRLLKTSPATMVQLLCELRHRFSQDDFQQRYKAIRKNAGPGDQEAIIQCALTVQGVVLPKYGFSGDIRGVMEMRGEVAAMTTGLSDHCVFKVMRDIHRLLDYGEPLAKLPFTRFLETPRFAASDRNGWLGHLNDQGFVVIAGVARAPEVEAALSLLWDFIEQTDSTGSVRRGDVGTWADSDVEHAGWPAGREDGIIHSRGIGQSRVLWLLRSLPALRQVFASLWGTEHLVCSFDGAGVFRPYGHKGSWRTKKTNWWHVDQAHRKRGLHCVQGLLTLTDATPSTGGLVVVPGSHRFHGDILSSHAPKKSGWDYIGLEANEKTLTEGDSGPRLVSARAGDLLLWDSRTVHCNTLPLEEDQDLLHGDQLVRAVAYICMTPAAWCTEKVANQRAAAFKRGVTTSHWPHEFHAMDIDATAPGFNLTKVQRELLSPQTAPGWRQEYVQAAPKPGRISLMPEAKYRVARQGGVDVYKSATTEWGDPLASLPQDAEVKGYSIGKWLRLSSWPRSIPLPSAQGDGEEDVELWAPLRADGDEANFTHLA